MALLHAFIVKITDTIQYLIKAGSSFYSNPPVIIDYALIVIFILLLINTAINYYKKKFKN